jgi:hypothetical protein
MRHRYVTRAAFALLPLWASACSGDATGDGLFEPRSTDGSLTGDGSGQRPHGDATTSAVVVGNFPGSGTSGSGNPLVGGLGPDTAGECPSDSVPAVGAAVAPVETICLYSADDADVPAATIEQVVEVIDEREWVHVRLTLNPSFVDNSYGDTAIGWEGREQPGKAPEAGPDGAAPPPPKDAPPPDVSADAPPPADGTSALPDPDAPGAERPAPPGPRPGGDKPPKPEGMPMGEKAAHTFRDLVGSDHAEIKLFDDGGAVSLHFKLDYISESAAAPSGYASLGVSGGEGKLIVGEPDWILAATTSLDRNLNACGLGEFLESSPSTDESYTPNVDASAWDYRVVYEVWVDPAAFGSSGFGTASIEFVHASPSKFENDTATVTPGPCLPPDDGTVIFPTEEPPQIR